MPSSSARHPAVFPGRKFAAGGQAQSAIGMPCNSVGQSGRMPPQHLLAHHSVRAIPVSRPHRFGACRCKSKGSDRAPDAADSVFCSSSTANVAAATPIVWHAPTVSASFHAGGVCSTRDGHKPKENSSPPLLHDVIAEENIMARCAHSDAESGNHSPSVQALPDIEKTLRRSNAAARMNYAAFSSPALLLEQVALPRCAHVNRFFGARHRRHRALRKPRIPARGGSTHGPELSLARIMASGTSPRRPGIERTLDK